MLSFASASSLFALWMKLLMLDGNFSVNLDRIRNIPIWFCLFCAVHPRVHLIKPWLKRSSHTRSLASAENKCPPDLKQNEENERYSMYALPFSSCIRSNDSVRKRVSVSQQGQYAKSLKASSIKSNSLSPTKQKQKHNENDQRIYDCFYVNAHMLIQDDDDDVCNK